MPQNEHWQPSIYTIPAQNLLLSQETPQTNGAENTPADPIHDESTKQSQNDTEDQIILNSTVEPVIAVSNEIVPSTSVATNHEIVVPLPTISMNCAPNQTNETSNEENGPSTSSVQNDEITFSYKENTKLFNNYKIDWKDLPKAIMEALNKNEPIGDRLHDFVHFIIAEMRLISKHLTIPICRNVAKQITGLFPKSFGILDHHGQIVDVDSVLLTTTLINHNNYLNRKEKVTLIPMKRIEPKNVKRVRSLFNDIPNFTGIETEESQSIEKMEEDRLWLKNNANVQLNDKDSKNRDVLFDKTFNLQRSFINNFESPPTIEQIKHEWPLLMKKKYLLRHFNLLMGYDTSIFIKNFEKSVSKINNSKQIPQTNDDNDDHSNIELFRALQNICTHFKESFDSIYCSFPVIVNVHIYIIH